MQEPTRLQVCLAKPMASSTSARAIPIAIWAAIVIAILAATRSLAAQELIAPQLTPEPLTSATLSAEILATQASAAPVPVQPVAHPLAIVPLDSKIPGGAAQVSGAVQVFNGRAFITDSGTITAGSKTVPVTVPYRGTLRICAATTVKMTADSSVPRGEIPGLMIAMDHGAAEASFATGRNSDFFLTPDFRILIGGPGAAEVKVRLGQRGDTCVDNSSADAPYVLVTSVFDGGSYRVQSGQRVMFQHGSLHEVVDQEKEPCGCPPEASGNNDFPLAQSEGLAPLLHPTPPPPGQVGHAAQSSDALVYNGAERTPKPAPAPPVAITPPPVAAAPAENKVQTAPPPEPVPAPEPPKKKRGFFKKLGGFFKKVFGAD